TNSQANLPTSAVFAPDGKMLIAASQDGVHFFETGHWIEKPELALAGECGPIAVTRDGQSLATMHPEQPYKTENLWLEVRVWDLSTRKIVRRINHVGGPPVFSPDGTCLATDSESGITLWSLKSTNTSPIRLEHSTNLLSHSSGYQHLRKTIAFSP